MAHFLRGRTPGGRGGSGVDEMIETKLGKISFVRVGDGGYQDAQFGVTIGLESKDGSSVDFKGPWNTEISASTKWTELDRQKQLGETFNWLRELMNRAKVDDVNKLKGVAVEITWTDQRLSSWRILEEVL